MSRESPFTSSRERRLWTWTAVVVLGIYATIGVTVPLTQALLERELVEEAFLAGFVLVLVAIGTHALGRRPGLGELAVLVGVAAVYLLVAVRITIPADRTHLVEYGVVAVLIHAALDERGRQGRPVPAPGWLTVGLTALVGAVDEGLQTLHPARVFDPRDLLFNVLAAAMAMAATGLVSWVRSRTTMRA